MDREIEIKYDDIFPGEYFTSDNTKRFFSGLKINSIIVDGIELNTCIVGDEFGDIAPDAGTLVYLDPKTIVKIDRPINGELVKSVNGSLYLKIKISRGKKKILEDMMRVSHLRKLSELMNNAITLLNWAQLRVLDGKVVASVDPAKHKYKEVLLPALENIAAGMYIEPNRPTRKSFSSKIRAAIKILFS